MFGKVEDFLESVGKDLGRLEVYKDLYKSTASTRFTDALQRVFEKYLAFFVHVEEFLTASKLKHWRDSVGLSSSERNKQMLLNLSMDLVTAECNNAVAEATLAEAQARARADQAQADTLDQMNESIEQVHGSIKHVHDDMERMRRSEIFENYLEWLKHVDVEGKLKDLLIPKKNAEKGTDVATSSWILEDEHFKKWITPSKGRSHVFWLTGEPGVGKSTLTAYIITEMQKWQPTGVAYFFCTYQDESTRTVDAVLRSWIWQLLRKPRHLQNASSGHLALPESEYGSTQSEEPSCDVLVGVMHQLYRQGRPTTLIVDGLDECLEPEKDTAAEGDWEKFFEVLKDAPEGWNILIVSRTRTWFRTALLRTLHRENLEREMVPEDNSDDIHAVVTQKLESSAKSNGWDDQLTGDAIRVLVKNAGGMFLYASLSCKDLANKRPDKVRAALDNPPNGLKGFYDWTMKEIDNQPGDLPHEFRTVLKWLVCGFRTFKLEELACALDLTPKVKNELDSVLGSFIRIDPETKEIQFVHASVRDYLLSPGAGIVDVAPESGQAKLTTIHGEILARCLEYITTDGRHFIPVGPNRNMSEQRIRDTLGDEPFLEYASIYWVQHLVERKRLKASKDHLDSLLPLDRAVLKWLQIFHFLFQFNFPGTTTTRHLIGGLVYHPPEKNTWQMFVHKNYPSFVDHLGWSDGKRFTRWDRFMHRRRKFDKYNEKTGWYQSPTYFSGPLLAAFFNYTEVLKRMANRGEDMDKKSVLNSTPLLWAATADSCSALQWLLDAGANMEVEYQHTKETPIFRAVRVPYAVNTSSGRYPAALLLHERGARLKAVPNDHGWRETTVLITLIETCRNFPGAVQLARAILKDDPARVEDYAGRGSLLQTAAWRRRPLILKALLQDEVVRGRINDQAHSKSTPLHDACCTNDPRTVKALIEHGADVNLRSRLNEFTPLHSAVLSGGDTVQALLEAGADPNLGACNGDTAVHFAAVCDVRFDLRPFLDHGFTIDRPNEQGMTALAVAIQHCNYAVSSQLLDLGADLERVPAHLHQQHPDKVSDERLDALRRKHWSPCWSLELCWRLRKAKMDVSLFSSCPPPVQESQKALKTFPVLPIPIIARIFKHADLYETLSIRRDGRITVDSEITGHGGQDRPYVMSPPIFGAASIPVQRLVLTVCGRCQSSGEEYERSYYEAKIVEETSKQCVKWEPEEVVFGHNGRQLQEKGKVMRQTVSNAATSAAQSCNC
ncbi:Zinc finger protein [Lasiodiplodia theobromae]|uniref:Zinc finger protein n=1 Tax=Lasiodiplodia theobromae TaxID=45133 RepID=UPI0015C2CE0B|nr:Zinc finger protein [Lasiodiplodia theobromae]KAF4545288.1 Zinc finger protein [Lasiodiplodia theobromae]